MEFCIEPQPHYGTNFSHLNIFVELPFLKSPFEMEFVMNCNQIMELTFCDPYY